MDMFDALDEWCCDNVEVSGTVADNQISVALVPPLNLISIQIGNWRSKIFDENMFVSFTEYDNAGDSNLLIAAVKSIVVLNVGLQHLRSIIWGVLPQLVLIMLLE